MHPHRDGRIYMTVVPRYAYKQCQIRSGEYIFARLGEMRLIGARGQLPPTDVPLCIMPHRLLNVFLDIDAGIREGKTYLAALVKEYNDYFGHVGVNDDMLRVNHDAAVCWDWASLAVRPPNVEEVQAFDRLAGKLESILKDGEKPDAGSFLHAHEPWPQRYELGVQYIALCKRIRQLESTTHCFSRVVTVSVSCLKHRSTPQSILLRRQRLGGLALPLYIISAFVGDGPSAPGERPIFGASRLQNHFDVKPLDMCLPGAYATCRLTKAGRSRRSGAEATRMHRASVTPSCYAVLLRPPLQGRLVEVIAQRRIVDPSLVARAIDTNPEINKLGRSHCYIACDAHHLCRFIHPSEAACERWGSLLHQLFDEEQNLPPWRMAARLFLRESCLRFTGDPDDEEFLEVIVDFLESGDGRKRVANPWTESALRTMAQGHAPPTSATVAAFQAGTHWRCRKHGESRWDPDGVRQHWGITRQQALELGCAYGVTDTGKGTGSANAEFRKRYRPSDLAQAHLAKLRRTIHDASKGSGRKTFDALPRIQGQDKYAGSTLRKKVADWMNSDRGREWQRRRAELFDHPDGVDNFDSRVEDDQV